ncbi:MAG: c-type cytochrome [Paraglaciecola sp.]|uniref:c-type cytochrome n=1 Tax=Paraglaciecola sp. TaxID=1920173 RepID=UPI0032970E67
MKIITLLQLTLVLSIFSHNVVVADVSQQFKDNPDWSMASAVSAIDNKLQIAAATESDNSIFVTTGSSKPLEHKSYLGDALISLEYLLPKDGRAFLVVQRRYDVLMPANNNEWQHMQVKYRTSRYDDASNKVDPAMVVEVKVNGNVVEKNVIYTTFSQHALTNWDNPMDGLAIVADGNPLALRNVSVQRADFSAITLPVESGGDTNEAELIDFVATGKDSFESVGCNVCHSVDAANAQATTGPNLYGLFTLTPREREIVEGGENHRFQIKADRKYLHTSIRTPASQLAVAEHGKNAGQAYMPIMPAFSKQVLNDQQVDAIGAYLATLNSGGAQGPVVKLMSQEGQAEYDPLKDDLQLLVDRRTRIQRGPLEGTSGRAIHVGQVNSINYSFDPRILGISKIWQGGYLDMGGEFQNRGGKGLKTGYQSMEINMGAQNVLMAPLNQAGQPIDFTFQSAIFGDKKRILAELYSKEDHVDKLAKVNAQFKGYDIDSSKPAAAPVFHYRVGNNELSVKTEIDSKGLVKVFVSGTLQNSQSFAINNELLSDLNVSSGTLEKGKWTLANGEVNGLLTAKIPVSSNPWKAPKSTFDFIQQPLKVQAAEANMPAGYSIENYYAPKDHYGREQLFEALGLAVAEDGTIVVATRTAGIWRLKNNQWTRFAEGTFDSLGVQIEDKHGLQLVVGQKAELTRISDTNGDGIADSYQTMFDSFSYHGNYHSYMHGPVRGGDGAYYLSINLADGGDGGAYNAGGPYMGSAGGYAGWHFRVDQKNSAQTWANGMRSPAGIGTAPDGKVWYSDNQGEYMGTSKIFIVEKDGFYGHPSSLVDLPGMTPDSPEILWEQVLDKRVKPIILLPHNRVANSPGNPAWDTSKGKFGPYSGQMLMGDQTQSNLFRVATEQVNGQMQGSVMPFIDGLESGVMRPVFLDDGSLLLGQTGRGWQAKGGHVASLQRVMWDGKTIAPAIKQLLATDKGFTVQLTQPIANSVNVETLLKAIKLDSWVYHDAPRYGSDEMGHHQEAVKALNVSDDRQSFTIELATLTHPSVHPQQTARVYHLLLQSKALFNLVSSETMTAYYSLYSFSK